MNYEQTIAERIQQRRRQIIVHSTLYYMKDESIISDHTWAKWAKELVELQRTYPEIADSVIFADDFKDFDGSTGFDLPVASDWAMNKAEQLLRLRRKE